jgi:multicomponent Na+:H+ antiporter subunit F
VTLVYWLLLVSLLLTIVAGLIFVTTRPGGPDGFLAALLFGSSGVAMTILLAKALELPRALDVALVLALLAAVLGTVFALRAWPPDESGEEDPS